MPKITKLSSTIDKVGYIFTILGIAKLIGAFNIKNLAISIFRKTNNNPNEFHKQSVKTKSNSNN